MYFYLFVFIYFLGNILYRLCYVQNSQKRYFLVSSLLYALRSLEYGQTETCEDAFLGFGEDLLTCLTIF